jgi:hypothetical protein
MQDITSVAQKWDIWRLATPVHEVSSGTFGPFLSRVKGSFQPPRSHTPETMTGCVAYPDRVARTHIGAEASSGARPSLWLFFGRLVGRYNPPHTKAHRTLGPTTRRRTGREAHRKVVLTHLEGRLRATALYGT